MLHPGHSLHLRVVHASHLRVVHAGHLRVIHAGHLRVIHAGHLRVIHAGHLGVIHPRHLGVIHFICAALLFLFLLLWGHLVTRMGIRLHLRVLFVGLLSITGRNGNA